MTDFPDPNWLPTSQLRWMHSSLVAHSAQIASHDKLLHQVILPAMLQRGAPSSPEPNPTHAPSPTPGTPSSILSPVLMKRARDLGAWVGLAVKVYGLIKWLGVILPSAWLAAVAVWKWVLPYLLPLLHSL